MMKKWFALNAAMVITYIQIQTLKVYHVHRVMKTARLALKQHAQNAMKDSMLIQMDNAQNANHHALNAQEAPDQLAPNAQMASMPTMVNAQHANLLVLPAVTQLHTAFHASMEHILMETHVTPAQPIAMNALVFHLAQNAQLDSF